MDSKDNLNSNSQHNKNLENQKLSSTIILKLKLLSGKRPGIKNDISVLKNDSEEKKPKNDPQGALSKNSDFLECIGHLHSKKDVDLKKGEKMPLQTILENAIEEKTGKPKDLTPIIQATFENKQDEENILPKKRTTLNETSSSVKKQKMDEQEDTFWNTAVSNDNIQKILLKNKILSQPPLPTSSGVCMKPGSCLSHDDVKKKSDLQNYIVESPDHRYRTFQMCERLSDAIKNKTGVIKDLSTIVSSCLKQEITDEFKPSTSGIGAPYEESKASNSDNELELDLLKEDLMCVVCNGMDVAARNRLLECSDCHALYHQECHRPVVVLEDSFSSWICQNCKDSKKVKQTTSTETISETSSPTKSSKSSSSHRHSSTSSSSSYKSTSSTSSSKSSDKYKSGSPSSNSKSSSTSSSATTTSSSTRSGLSPNINIISADKRIQNMKKKAAKLQEKRKQLR